MDKSEMIKAAQAVLFASGESVSTQRLSEVFELTKKETDKLMEDVITYIDKCQWFWLAKVRSSLEINQVVENFFKKMSKKFGG